jgi:hypothetical protein
MSLKSFLVGVVAAFLLMASAASFLIFFPKKGPEKNIAVIPSQPSAMARSISGSLQVPSFLRSRFKGQLVVVGFYREILPSGHSGLMADIPAWRSSPITLDENGVGKFASPTLYFRTDQNGKAVRLALQLCMISEKLASEPSTYFQDPCPKGPSELLLLFRKDIVLPKTAEASNLDLGLLKPVFSGSHTGNREGICPDTTTLLSGTILPTESFLRAHPPGTPVLFLLQGYLQVQSKLKEASSWDAFERSIRSKDLKKFYLHAEMLKVDAAGMKFQAMKDTRSGDILIGSVFVCKSEEPLESCIKRVPLIPSQQKQIGNEHYALVGENLLFPNCGLKNFTYHLHDFSSAANSQKLPKEILESQAHP